MPSYSPTRCYFYPRSPCGERHEPPVASNGATKFLSTLSLRRATTPEDAKRWNSTISIHALLAESDGIHYDNYNLHCVISIHALLAESDRAASCQQRSHQISIHALLAESDAEHHANSQQEIFLSTLSLRRATYLGAGQSYDVRDFYPRSPCGERP